MESGLLESLLTDVFRDGAAGCLSRALSACYNLCMAAVVGVHGIGQQFGGGYQLGAVWYDALRDGLSAAGYRPAAVALVAADLRGAFFGDLFRPSGAMAAPEAPFSAADVEPGLERDLLVEFYRAVVEQEVALGAPEGGDGAWQGWRAGDAGPPAALPDVRWRGAACTHRQLEASHALPGRWPGEGSRAGARQRGGGGQHAGCYRPFAGRSEERRVG